MNVILYWSDKGKRESMTLDILREPEINDKLELSTPSGLLKFKVTGKTWHYYGPGMISSYTEGYVTCSIQLTKVRRKVTWTKWPSVTNVHTTFTL